MKLFVIPVQNEVFGSPQTQFYSTFLVTLISKLSRAEKLKWNQLQNGTQTYRKQHGFS